MKKANISTTKNNLSRLLDEVKRGEAILIVDRNVPVARLEPVTDLGSASDRIPGLARDGVVDLPSAQLDVELFLTRERTRLTDGASATKALLDERRSSR